MQFCRTVTGIGGMSMNMALKVRVDRNRNELLPGHHIAASQTSSGWPSYLSSWGSAPNDKDRPRTGLTRQLSSQGSVADDYDLIGFQNPWPSWHRPTRKEVWDSLQWGEDHDPCIALAASHLSGLPPPDPDPRKRPNFGDTATAAKAAALLCVETPDFSFNSSENTAKVTWLGHASILVQLRPLSEGSQPLRCLFDPIFSARCSPSQIAGPIRSYPPPCEIQALPPIDVVFISHNHYDHLDLDTVMSLWKRNEGNLIFVVPLGNKQWFIDGGILADCITELDWWESALLSRPGAGSKALKVWCTPAQHSSGRSGIDDDSALWSSWYLEHPSPKPYRIFFAGDTGYQFHASPDYPPSPPSASLDPNTRGKAVANGSEGEFPVCPTFAEINSRLGPPHLLLLPVAVGATYAYLRSLVFLPDWISPFPRHGLGLTAAAHTPAWDAVRVMRALLGIKEGDATKEHVGKSENGNGQAVAIAMHWGTFVTDAIEVLKTLGQLEWACHQHGLRFDRSLPEDARDRSSDPCFLALNHGQSVTF